MNQIEFKTTILKASLCDHSDAYVLLKGMITIAGEGDTAGAKQKDERAKGVISINCASFTDCMTEIISMQIYNAKYLDILMRIHNVIEYSDNYLKATESYFQFCRDEPNAIKNSWFIQIQGKNSRKKPDHRNAKNVEIVVLFKN